MTPDGKPARFTVLGMGKLGGLELNYSSDIDLIFLYDYDGKTDGQRSISNREFFEQLAREMTRLVTERTELGSVYRVDLRLRPEGERGPMVVSLESAMRYYDLRGRTWERQAFIKARPVAGSLELGGEFLERLTPWIYRRYLTSADISGIKALKRRIEQQTHRAGADDREVKTGHGGIRDVEFVIQFLQLLNGGALPEVRTGNTLEALARLEQVGCLTNQERTLLEENYSFLRKVEHRLQIMFDLQTHLLPSDDVELRKLALRMDYADTPDNPALDAFVADYRNKTQLNRKILDHLLHDAFSDEEGTAAEVDLVLDPDPQEERIAGSSGKISLPRLEAGVSPSDGLGRGKTAIPFHAALPAFFGGHRAAIAFGHRRHGRSRSRRSSILARSAIRSAARACFGSFSVSIRRVCGCMSSFARTVRIYRAF